MHLLVALRRKKDEQNHGLDELCFRQVYRNDTDLELLSLRMKNAGGYWRVYRTVNERDPQKALKMFQHELLDNKVLPENFEQKWKSVLLNPENKTSRNFLLDLDTSNGSIYSMLVEYLLGNNIKVFDSNTTPNGYHVVTEPFDTRQVVNLFKDLEVKKDSLFFLHDEHYAVV